MISGVICTYNREQFLPKLFSSILKQTISREYLEIIIVNNNSTDSTEEVCKKWMSELQYPCKYVVEYNQGLSYARNRGISESKGEIISFIDDDAFLDENYFQVVWNSFNVNKAVLAIGGPIFLDYESTPPKWENPFMNSLLGYFNLGKAARIFPKNNYPRGSNMNITKKAFEAFGMFNVNLGRTGNNLLGGEEKEFFERIIQKEAITYNPNAIVYHSVPIARTLEPYIKKQAKGNGASERIRVEKNNKKISWMFLEIYKCIVTIGLFFYYFITLRPAKGIMLVKFRYWNINGFINAYKK